MKTEHEVRRLFAEHDMTIHSIRRNGHWVVKAAKPGLPYRCFTVAVSPSDGRSMKNLTASLKRGFSRQFAHA